MATSPLVMSTTLGEWSETHSIKLSIWQRLSLQYPADSGYVTSMVYTDMIFNWLKDGVTYGPHQDTIQQLAVSIGLTPVPILTPGTAFRPSP